MRLKFLLISFLLLLTVFPAGAYWHTKQIDITDGLSQPSITAITSDNKGIIWIGTRFGLQKYRNGTLKTYTDTGEENPMITGNQVSFLFRQADGTLWASTDRGLSRYNESEDRFELIRSEAILCALEAPDCIWFGGYEGLLIYDKASGVAERLTLDTDGTPLVVTGIFSVGPGRLLALGRTPVLVSIDIKSRALEQRPITGMDGQMIQNGILYGGHLYLSVFREGIVQADPISGNVLRYWNSGNSGLTFDVVMSMAVFRGRLYLGTDGGGICVMDADLGIIRTMQQQLNLSSSPFNSTSFSALYASPDGSLWAGTVRHGVFNLRETPIRSFDHKDGLTENVVNGFYASEDGRVWIATDGGGLNIYDPLTERITACKNTDGQKVSSVCEMPDGRMLLSIYSKGLFFYNPKTGKHSPFCIVNTDVNRQELLSGYTPEVVRNREDIFILASAVYKYSGGRFQVAGSGPDFSGLHLFGKDREGRLLFFSYLNIWRLVPETLEWERLYRADDSHFINAAALSGDTIWLGTDYGVRSLRTDTGTTDRLPSNLFNRVTSLQATEDGILWIAADNSLFRYSTLESRLEMVDEGDGFAPNEVLSSLTGSPGGYPVYLGTPKGFILVSEGTGKRTEQLETEFYEAILDGKHISPSSELTLPRNYKNLEIATIIRGLNPFSRRQVRFTLSSGTLKQISTSYENSFRIGELPPGHYTLTASCRMLSGEWSREKTLISFHVQSPWYKTMWFYLLLITVILVAITLVVQYLHVRQRERYAQDRIRFLTQISHELKTPLTLIYVPLKRILKAVSGSEVEQQLTGVFKNVERMRDLTKLVLDKEHAHLIYDHKSFLEDSLQPADDAAPQTDLSTRRVLCVEDNVELRNLLQEELSPYFAEIMVAADGEEGLTRIRMEKPDIVISDVMMPRMDGFELCRRVKSDLEISHIPFVLLTARGDTTSTITGYKAGADSYLAKPFETELLVQVVQNLLDTRTKLRQRFLSVDGTAPTPEETTFANTDEQFLLRLNSLIESRLGNAEIDVSAMAMEMAMSRASLYNKVKALTGLGVAQYIDTFRIRKACALLSSGDEGVAQIADKLGFSSPRYFSSHFKQVTGLSPLAYRKEKKHENRY